MAKPRGWQVSLGPALEAEIVNAFKSGKSAADLARQHERSNSHIYSILLRAGLRPGEHWRPGIPRDLELEQKIVGYYQRPRSSAREAARRFRLSYATILAVLKRQNVPIKPPKVSQIIVDRVGELRLAGATQKTIAADVGISQAQVSRVLNKLGLETDPHRAGPKHGNWKGGRIITSHGYVRVWLQRDHPFFEAMALHDGYVFEHRLVMAEMLGRPLLKSEAVHHIDGDRLHNAPENLQLRQKNHGKGVVLRCRKCGSRDIEATKC